MIGVAAAPYVPLGREEERSLLERAVAGDMGARDDLVLHHHRLAEGCAKRAARRSPELFEDLVQEGVRGLLHAVSVFDLERDVRFNTFARWWVRHYVDQYVLHNRGPVRPNCGRAARKVRQKIHGTWGRLAQELGRDPTTDELAERLGVEPRHLILISCERDDYGHICSGVPTAEELMVAAEERQRVTEELERLSPRDREVMRLRCMEDLSLREVGLRLGITGERARQLQNAALSRLRARLGTEVAA